MSYFGSPLGFLSRLCEGQLGLASSCVQKTVIDAVNLLFLFMFYLLLVSSLVVQGHGRSNTRRGKVFVFVSLCCATISLAYLSTGMWDFIAKDGRPVTVGWVVHMVRGIIWITLAISSIVQTSRWVAFLSSLWWTSSFVLVSTLNVNMLLAKEEIEILTVVQWPANFLLLICAFKRFGQFFSHWERKKSLLEPLLAEDQKKGQSGQGLGSFFSQLTFSWVSPLLRLGNSKLLVLEDIPSLFSEDEASVAHQKFSAAWEYFRRDKRTDRDNNLVIKALIKVYFKEMMCIGIGAFLKTTCVVVSPLLLYAFVRYADSQDEDLNRGLFLLGCMITVKVVEALSQRHWFFQARRTGMRMRSALMVAVYRKQLKLSGLGRKNHSTGEIVNYIAVDAYRMGEFPWWFHSGWTFTVQLFLAIGVLFGVVGVGALPGLIPLLVSGLLNVPYARLLQDCGSRFMKAQDERLRATSEILNNMKVIKLQSWEEKFKNLIDGYRDKEFAQLIKSQHLRAAGTPIFWMCPTIISSVVFLGCTFFGSTPLNAATIFTVLATLRTMSEPVRMIPEALSALIQAVVSFHRINTFLFDDDLNINEMATSVMKNSENCIEIQEGNFSWEPESGVQTLRDVNLEVRKGQKIAVCGPVGAGKSSLLYAILKEIPKITGQVASVGSVAYVSQTSWIQSGTVRENILYGRPMEQDRYRNAIKASALDKDINSFQHGDLTEIGQRGINMSGGQKQRIQLARAVYNDADIYLLDDPFSAVDAHTAATLFHECVMTSLGNKTVILVTHQVEFLTTVDKILVMEDGRISQCGAYKELLMAGTAFEQLVNAHKDSITVPDSPISEIKIESWAEEIDQTLQDNGSECINGNNSEGQVYMKESPLVQLTEEEEKEIGDVGWKPFFDYLQVSKGLSSLCLGTVAQIGFVICQAAATYWLAYATEIPSIKSTTLIGVYAGISTLSTFFVYGRSFFAAHLGLKASKAFFSGLTSSIFKAPMLFFDSTPVGRIFTRVSSDLSILDNDISFAIGLVMAPAIELLAIVGVMASVTWQVLIVAILTFGATKYIQGYYLRSAREIVRMNGTTKAPVMNYAAETALGVTTIRAFNMADRFFQKFLTVVDTDARLFFYTNASTEWLVLRIEALQNMTLFTATFFFLLLPKGFVASGLVGLSLSYALALTGTQVFMVRWYCNLTNYVISVERIKQFMNLAVEPPAVVDDNRPPCSWPAKGRIELQDLQVKYRPNAPLVLKGITCRFEEGTRVGVVGRTGSGKTTLISALFRLVEPESGRILIDGLDITSIGLKDLRTKLSIIPQEPTLFRGSIRSNLDPLALYSDYEIWEALEKCQLKETVSSLQGQLDSSVSDEGENWSTGQRQLFCLGRVLLKRNKILVLDEATASIDSATDAILQRIIRQEFAECTVITVAHRVPTVIDSDKVMVLSYGRLIEYEEPWKLMQGDSAFGKLVAEYWSSCGRKF